MTAEFDQQDTLLNHLLEVVLSVVEEHSITLIVSGSVISGVAIPAAKYYESLDNRMADALAAVDQSWPTGTYAALGERFGDGLPRSAGRGQHGIGPRFVHLRDAEVDGAGGSHFFRFLRVRLADISAWDVGAKEE